MRRISTAERRLRLGTRHYLARPAGSIEAGADGLVGFHASDPASVFLAIQARSPESTIAGIENALYDRRTLARVLGMRRTMFAVTREVGAVVRAAVTRALSVTQHARLERDLATAGAVPDPKTWIDRMGPLVVDHLRSHGPATTRDLARMMPELQIRFQLGIGKWATEVGVASRLLFLLATDSRVLRAKPLGSWLSSQYRWEAADPQNLDEIDAEAATTRLVDGWLRAYGPGTMEDLVWWTGLPRRVIMPALQAAQAGEVELENGAGWIASGDLDDTEPVDDWVALLPALDSTVMGWRRREWYLDPSMTSHLFDRNGNAGPTVWVNGRVVGGWGQGGDGRIRARLLEPVSARTGTMISDAADRLTEWLAGTVVTPRFPTALWRSLSTD